MPTSDAELEQTRQQTIAINAQFEALAQEALDPSKQLAPLVVATNKEIERLGEIVNVEGAPPGTGVDCLIATAEMLGDWAVLEANIIVALDGKGDRPASAPSRPGPRRGMRI
jgi:hypothetical protein